ncbi:MAG: ATP-dependent DNA helicase RecG [Candidatus Omnitrophota bacterium]
MERPLDTSIQYLKGIGPKRADVFKKIGIRTIEDLLYYFPRRYEDRGNFSVISRLQEGHVQTIKAEVLANVQRRSFRRRGFTITEVVVADQTGKVSCVWFNQPYLKNYFKVGESLILFGKVERYGARIQMSSPEFEIAGDDSAAFDLGRLIPVYSLPEGITQRYFRRIVKYALDEYMAQIKEFLPFDIRSRNNLLNLAKSLVNIHFPADSQIRIEAYERLCFDEFFIFQLPLVIRKFKKKDKIGISHQVEGDLAGSFMERLPFRLTVSQERVISEIKTDMAKPAAMQRLLQGDVGSGKTVVAVIASLFAIQGGYQAVLMVPTEILAKQHYEKISCQLSAVGNQQKKIKLGLLTSSADKKTKQEVYRQIRDGGIDLLIGTHALLEEAVEFKNLGLVVIDEQHKFGVGQRALLPKRGANPDVLIMTATPIPRTLAITLYGDLDISIISELPPGRVPIKTLSFNRQQRSQAYRIVREQLKLGRQAYIIYPLIAESDVLDISGAEEMFIRLKSEEFKEFRLGLIHGRLEEKKQDEIMSGFKSGDIDILVSTTVLEVGIDIPNATGMIIEYAERFGLSQLHQLRGRIGRGEYESFCILLGDAQTPEAQARLSAMARYNDGFRIAEEDLKIRGPGEFFGNRQHGLADLKIANPLTQMRLLKRAREEAIKLINLDPHFQMRQNGLLKERLLQRFPEYEKLVVVG